MFLINKITRLQLTQSHQLMIQKEPFYSTITELKVIISNLFRDFHSNKQLHLFLKIPLQYWCTIDLHRIFSQQSGFCN